MSTGITSIVDQTLGRSRIPASAAPVTQPSFAQLPTGGKKRKPDLRGLIERHENGVWVRVRDAA